MQLFRSIVGHSGKVFKAFPVVYTEASIKHVVSKDTGLTSVSKLILVKSDLDKGLIDKSLIDQITSNNGTFAALAKADKYRLRDVVYYWK